MNQGFHWSPFPFNILLGQILRVVQTGRKYYVCNIEQNREDLDYADDICLLSYTRKNLHAHLDDILTLAETGRKKYMCNQKTKISAHFILALAYTVGL